MHLAPHVFDYVEVRNPTTKAQLLQLVAMYEKRHGGRGTQGPINNVAGQDWDLRRRLPDRCRDGNWRVAGVINRQNYTRVTNVDSNGFRYRGGAGNQRFENRIQRDQSDHRSASRRSRNDFVNRS
ncbi:hypothetical protein TNCV_380331 [Trichonephila clavipes]|nr:hypothetical protein TNCV_380331 [Trichonephila clavipes]